MISRRLSQGAIHVKYIFNQTFHPFGKTPIENRFPWLEQSSVHSKPEVPQAAFLYGDTYPARIDTQFLLAGSLSHPKSCQ